jgi:hypothetical protein
MRVTAAGGRLRLLPHDGEGVVLDVPLDRVRVRALDDAGSVRVEVDDAPLLVTFGAPVGDPAGRVRRLVHDTRTRRVRRAFLAACGDDR